MGLERNEQNHTVRCFVDGDRRFLHDVTKDNIRNVGQKSRTNPSLRQSKTGRQKTFRFCFAEIGGKNTPFAKQNRVRIWAESRLGARSQGARRKILAEASTPPTQITPVYLIYILKKYPS